MLTCLCLGILLSATAEAKARARPSRQPSHGVVLHVEALVHGHLQHVFLKGGVSNGGRSEGDCRNVYALFFSRIQLEGVH